MKKTFKAGQKVRYKNKIYDFGYIGAKGHAIIYKEGERSMQDSLAVNLKEVEPLGIKQCEECNGKGLIYI